MSAETKSVPSKVIRRRLWKIKFTVAEYLDDFETNPVRRLLDVTVPVGFVCPVERSLALGPARSQLENFMAAHKNRMVLLFINDL